MKISLDDNRVRQIIRMTIAMLFAFLVEYLFARAHIFLVPIATCCVMLTSTGNVLYQGLKQFAVLMVALILLSFIFPLPSMLYERLYDVCLGAGIGVLCGVLIFPRKVDKDFRTVLIPLLTAYKNYFSAIMVQLYSQDKKNGAAEKIEIESCLQSLPVWVYEKGFDVGLSKGHQYFLMKIVHIAEILFSLHQHARCEFDSELLNDMRGTINACAEKINLFFDALLTVFELKKLIQGVDDFEAEYQALEQAFQKYMPMSLDLFQCNKQDMHFYAIIYAIADLRKALIKLGQALR